METNAALKKNSIFMVYGKMCILAFVFHVLFTGIFVFMHIVPLIIYHIFSSAFYAVLYLLIQKSYFRTIVSLFHIEVIIFSCVSSILIGWDTGFSFYIIILLTLVYFWPYQNKTISYLFSAIEVIAFILLKVYTTSHKPAITIDNPGYINAFYFFNVLASFSIILFASFISKVSSALIEQDLIDSNYKLQEMVNYDALTHLWSRQFLTDMFNQKVSTGADIVIVMADIDNFKAINDTYGHICGDYVLAQLASILREQCPEKSGTCRWGGEEFVIMFYGDTLDSILQDIEEIRKTIAAYPFKYNDALLHITMTFGISSTNEAASLKDLILLADERLYEGKQAGKNTVVFPVDPNLHNR